MRKVSYLFIFSVVLFNLLAGAKVQAADRNQPRIAVVDMQFVLEASIAGKAAKTDLDGQMKKAKANIEVAKAKLRRQQEELKKQGMLLSAEAIETKREQIAKDERALQRQVQDMQNDIQRFMAKKIDAIVQDATNLLEGVASEEGYDFVFEKSNQYVVYASKTLDVSQKVVELLDEKHL